MEDLFAASVLGFGEDVPGSVLIVGEDVAFELGCSASLVLTPSSSNGVAPSIMIPSARVVVTLVDKIVESNCSSGSEN